MGGMDPRQMALMMRKMGIEMRDIPDVQEVIVRTPVKEYRFLKPSVSVMKAQGSETWQVQGKPQAVDRATAPAAPVPLPPAPTLPSAEPPIPTNTPIPEEDVRMVMEQTGKDAATARKALESSGGDIAEAIVKLS